MTREEKKRVIEADPVAYWSGAGGVEIKYIEYGINDHIVFVAGAWRSNRSAHRAKIYYNGDSTYFMYNGYKIRLDECIRCDTPWSR